MEGNVISPPEDVAAEVEAADGVVGRDIGAKDAARGDSCLSTSCRQLPEADEPPAAGFRRFSTPIGRDNRCSGGVEDGGGVGRIDTPCTDGVVCCKSWIAAEGSFGWVD